MAMNTSYIDQILYDSQGHTGNVYYCRMIKYKNAEIWDNVSKILAVLPAWEDSAIILNEIGQTGQFPVVIPADLPVGVYDIVIYHQAGSCPHNSDDIEKQYTMTKGDIFGF